MTGPEHYAEAERLLTLADRHTRGVTYDQEWTLTLTAARRQLGMSVDGRLDCHSVPWISTSSMRRAGS